MRRSLASLPLMLTFPLVVPACGTPVDTHPVRATLDDGQVLLGAVRTETLVLETGVGRVEVPLADIGQVAPVEGGALGGSGDHVNIWLQNGSELVGQWADPELRVDIDIGGAPVGVDLPMDQLQRFQTQGGDKMPTGAVYRVRTIYGDDVLVDPAETRLVVDNALGSFTPTLAECVSAAPLDDPEKDWRLELETGTVLIGRIGTEGIDFQLPMGPDSLTVPLAALVSLERQDWGTYDSYEELQQPMPAAAEPMQQGGGAAPPPPKADERWFDNRRQSGFKRSM